MKLTSSRSKQVFAANVVIGTTIVGLVSLWLFSWWMEGMSITDWRFIPSVVSISCFWVYLGAVMSAARDDLRKEVAKEKEKNSVKPTGAKT